MSYNEELQSNNEELQGILQSLNELPDAKAPRKILYVDGTGADKYLHKTAESVGTASEIVTLAELQSIFEQNAVIYLRRDHATFTQLYSLVINISIVGDYGAAIISGGAQTYYTAEYTG